MSPSKKAATPEPGVVGALIDGHDVVICAGPGGVGKTTTAAAIAVQAAAAGKRACVVTIDPARRLADALGLESLTHDPVAVEGPWSGGLWALMLDTKQTFDGLVRRYASSPSQAEAILSNRFYRNISGALSGTQEYMAVEKLYELHESGDFDLVVVDTPPSRHALDFLDAPKRLTRFLDNRFFRLLMMPARTGLRAVNIATQLFLRTVSRVVGGEVVRDALAFFNAFEGMEQGFRERAGKVDRLLSDPRTGFVVVAAPRQAAVDEATYFTERLAEAGHHVATVVVNRVTPSFGGIGKLSGATDGSALGALVANAAQFAALAASEQSHIQRLSRVTAGAPLVTVPDLVDEVHDLDGLQAVAGHLG